MVPVPVCPCPAHVCLQELQAKQRSKNILKASGSERLLPKSGVVFFALGNVQVCWKCWTPPAETAPCPDSRSRQTEQSLHQWLQWIS